MKRPYFIYVLTLLTIFIFSLKGKSQDTIIKKAKVEVKCKIEEITPDNIVKYKEWNDLNGPTHYLKQSDTFTIKYGNKNSATVNKNNQITNQSAYINSFSFGYVNIFEEHGIAIDYERVIQDNISLRFPLYVAFEKSGRNTEVFINSGINLKYYLYKSEWFDAFAGPEVNIGSYFNSDIELFPFQVLGDIGFTAKPTKELKITVHTGLGYESGISEDYSIPGDFAFNLNIGLGYHF